MSALEFKVIDFSDASLHKTAVLVTGAHEALLVDTGLRLSDGRRLVEEVRATGKPLSRVVISHGDPDFYFGAEVIEDAFPEVRFLASPQVVARIEETYRDKLAAWAHLGEELSTRLVKLAPLTGDSVGFEGHRFELRGADFHLPDRHYFWEHRTRTILGGVLLFQGLHAWTADTPAPAQRAAWIDLLDGMGALDPAYVVAGHRTPGARTDTGAIDWTREYLKAFETELGKATDAAEAEAGLRHRFPDAGLAVAVELGTKVAKGELTWG